MAGYRTIVADPPWDVKRLSSPMHNNFNERTRPIRSIPLTYPTMSIEAIASLPVAGLAAADAHLYLWTINRYVEQTYEIARAWGFRPAQLLTWAKAPQGIGPGGAFSQWSEHILFCRRGTLAATRRTDRNWWQWKRAGHSAKPDAFFDVVESVSPGPYLELFARRARPGWDVWGDEAPGSIEWEATAA